ncbi:MAG: aminoacyl-histidine dipeptidase [Bacteroidales bacterium]|nr:aminoacyl-histidine dipeptidase [Bacteroidales bacterium]
MNDVFKGLYPELIWKYFDQICKVPRPSKKEEKISAYIQSVANELGLECLTDETGNILVRKGASKGYENLEVVVLQSHIDMVCEKNSDTYHDFEKDPIVPRVEGEWVKAMGTTLGADDGIGIAAQLAIMEDKSLEHGPLEFLFTVDEETGLTGAKGLRPGFLKGNILLNLDSEDEGELFIGCAGGKDTTITFTFSKVPVNYDCGGFLVKVTGLKGGHSGDDINKGLGNANKILNRLLWNASNKYEMRISSFDGGNLRNAISREAFATVTVPKRFQNEFIKCVKEFNATIKAEFKTTEPGLLVSYQSTEMPSFVMDLSSQERLLNSLYACPHGVIAMSADIPNFVETSTNLASVKFNDKQIIIGTSQRSSSESGKDDVVSMVVSVFRLAGAKIVHSDGYPGWTPNPTSPVLDITRNAYEQLFKTEPKVLAIHAGLECGLIGEQYPEMDMISYGPTIKGAHSPDERLLISTVGKFWDLTLEVLRNIPVKK